MKTSLALSAISFALVIATPACSGKFASLGDLDAGQGGGVAEVGGAGHGTGGAISSVGGATSSCECTGPRPMIANTLCDDGSMGGPVCVTESTGSCNWQIRTCPPSNVGGASGVGGSTGVSCLYDGVNYSAGDSFKSTDGCNTCSCTSNGQVACTLMACLATGGSSGVGGSTGTGCVCSGPTPGAPNIICWDGSMGGPICETNSTGACSWQIRICPPNPGSGGATGAGGSTGVTCVYNNVNYAAGISFPAGDGCNKCSCTSSGGVVCTKIACPAGTGGSSGVGGSTGVSCLSNGVNYPAGSSFPSPDGCNTCSCTSSGAIICTERACQVGSGGASSAGGAGQGGNTSCPAITLAIPQCDNGTAILKYDPSTGCPTGYGCPTCPTVNFPNITCSNYQLVTDPTTGCPSGYTCPTVDASTCPPIALVVPVCANGTASLKHDPSTGCATGYGCP